MGGGVEDTSAVSDAGMLWHLPSTLEEVTAENWPKKISRNSHKLHASQSD